MRQNGNQKIKILISGPLNLGPIGRHLLSFFKTLIVENNNKIFIDKYWFDNFGPDKAEKEELKNLFAKQRISVLHDHSINNYDFLIYTGVLSHGASDRQIDRIIDLKAKIKICYPVFDGTVPPLEWIDIINDHFDICTSPSNYVAHNLIRYGVKVACFGLHCVILNDELLIQKPKNDIKKIRFGFIGAAEQRKNPIKVIEAFHKNFEKNDNVELFMHCSYSFEKEYLEDLFILVNKYKKTSNIIFSYGKNITHEEMIKSFLSFNCYIYPQKTSGYFTTPAEALSLGIPIIISDIGVHQELVQDSNLNEEDGVFLIPCNMAEPICHQSLDKRYLGAQYDCEVEDVSKGMMDFYKIRTKLFDDDSIRKRKDVGAKYSAENLSDLYNNMIRPNSIFNAKLGSYLDKNIFMINSSKLLSKYKNLFPDLRVVNKFSPINKFHFIDKDHKVTDLIESFSVITQNQYFQISSKNQIATILKKHRRGVIYRLKSMFRTKSFLKKEAAIKLFCK